MNNLNLDEQTLLANYRQAKDLEVERLLTQYGSSLKDMRELYPQLTTAVKQRQLTTALPNMPLFFTPSDLEPLGYQLQEGWLLKLSPTGTGDYTSSYITPSKWEIQEGETYISPEGTKYNRADLETLLSEPTGDLAQLGLMPASIEELTEKGQELYRAYQEAGGELDIGSWVQLKEKEYVEAESIFGKVFPQEDVDELIHYIDTNPQGFLADMREIGRTEDSEALLRLLYPEITEEDLTALFTPTLGSPELRQNLIEALAPVTEGNIDWAVQYFSDNPHALRSSLIGEGRNEATERLVRQLFPDVTEQQISDYFSLDALTVEAMAAEGGKGKWGTFTAGVGDLVANVGGIFKWAGKEGIGEKIIKLGQFMQVQAAPVPFEPDEFTWKQLFNPQFYATYGIRMLPNLMVLAIPGIGAYGLAGSIAARVGLGAVGRAIITGVGGAVLSRPLESAMEAGGAYDEAINKGLSHTEAELAANRVFMDNLKLGGLDAFQIAVAFMPTPIGKAAAGAVTRGLVTTAKIGGKMFFVGLTEGGEEIYQEMILKRAMGDERGFLEMIKDPDMQLVFSLGAIAGLGMGAGGDIIVRIQNRIIPQLTPEQKAQFDTAKADGIGKGLDENVATQKALDEVVEQNPKLGKVVEDAAKTVEKEITFEQIDPKDEVEKVAIDHLKEQVAPKVTPVTPEVTEPRIAWYEEMENPDTGEAEFVVKGETAAGLPIQLATFNSAEEARSAVERIKATPQAAPGMPEAKVTEVTPAKPTVADKLVKAKETIRALRQKKASVEQLRTTLVDIIKEHLPLSHQGELLAKVKNIETEADLVEYTARIEELAEAGAEKTLRADIIQELKETKPRIEKGITIGKLTDEVQVAIEKLRASLLVGIKGEGGTAQNVEYYEAARAKIEQNIVDYREGKITWDAMMEANEELKYTGMYGMSSVQLQEALDYIQELKRLGKDLRGRKFAELKAHRKEIVGKSVTEITGGEGIKPGVGTLRGEDLEGTRKILDQPVNSQYGFVNLLDKLGKFAKGTKQYQGFLMRFANLTQRAVNMENMERERTFRLVRDKFQQIYNVPKIREATRLLTTLCNEDVDLGTFKILTDEGVKYLQLRLTKAEMMEAYQLYRNPKNLETFKEGMHWTTEIMTKIVDTLTDQDIAWAGWLQNEFYDTYYDKINPFYRQEYNINMPKNPDYVPQSRDFDAGETDEVQMLLKDQKRYASVTNKSLKARQWNLRPFQFKGVFTVLTNHIVQMEHFMAWGETMHELRSTFGNNEVRTAIRQYHSNDILKRLDDYMNDFARGGVDRAQFLSILDKLRSRFAVSVLAVKPSIGLQQIWTVGAFMTEMKARDFITGITSFWSYPIANYQWMMENSTYLQNRYHAGNYERDIRLSQQQGVAKTLSGQGNISQWLLWQVTQGDKFGVMPGWWAKYQAGLKAGLTQEAAMTEADSASERTQNTSELASLSWLQRGSSWGKLLTMFQSQPNKYFRIVGDNIRNMQYGRQSKVKGLTNLFIVWVLLPMLFQFVADAFHWKKERQLRVLLLGPLNNILVAGQLVQTAWGWFTGDSFDWQASPVLSTVRDLQNFSMKLIKIINEIKDPYEDVAADDIVSAVEFFSKGIGQLLGLPTPYLIMVERAIRDGDPRELIFSKWALEEASPDLQSKTNKLANQLGQVVEDVTDLPVDKKPPVYDTGDAFSDVRKALEKTLLSDVTEKNGYSPQVVSIAQALLTQDLLGTFPNKPLHKIIDDILGDDTLNYTFSQYYMDYQDRLKITSLAELKEWDAEHPRFNLGNVTPAQYQLIRQYEALTTEAEREQFIKDHPELSINPRDEWLRAHPEENALLALWGQAKILTLEAYNATKKLVDKLDIPDGALPEFTLPPEGSVENYFKYNEAGEQFGYNSAEVKLLLLEDDELRQWLGREEIEGSTEYYRLQINWRDAQAEYDALDTAEAKEQYLTSHPEFRDDRNRMKAMDAEFPESLIEDWVAWYAESRSGYQDDWWLLGHRNFYETMLNMGIWTEPRDFSKVPTKAVWNLYETYLRLSTGEPRLDFRRRNPSLDAWLVLSKGYTPVGDR